MMGWIYWDPEPSLFTLPYFHWPILWYSLFFAFGFLAGFSIFVRIAARYFLTLEEGRTEGMKKMKQKAALLADKLSVYVIFGTIVGAR
jgi:prolipoprotein diacylglyceryltransferase